MSPPTSRSATLLVVCAAHFLMPFMMSAVGVALPAIGREFNASALQLGLVETTYVLSASIFLLAMGRPGDIHGRDPAAISHQYAFRPDRLCGLSLIGIACSAGRLGRT